LCCQGFFLWHVFLNVQISIDRRACRLFFKNKRMKKMMCTLSLLLALTVAGVNHASAQTTTKSRAGKNAAIGAGAGAVTGAVVSKHKGKGAIIGGAVGAVGGYAWGKHQDKKKGRKVVTKH
jgi:uncharacterized protein YqgC (DUF456 family)